ncbi:hypothetical protein GCM10009609_62140 [Pseudonocardia aurantiaca]
MTLYTDVASAAAPPTSAAETAMSVALAAIDTAKDQKWSHPRIRGLTSGAPGEGESRVPVVTHRDYGTPPSAEVYCA